MQKQRRISTWATTIDKHVEVILDSFSSDGELFKRIRRETGEEPRGMWMGNLLSRLRDIGDHALARELRDSIEAYTASMEEA